MPPSTLHLSHPFVQRLLARFLAQGFGAQDLSRVCEAALDTPGGVCFACRVMIRELTIENFRGFRELHLTGLARVNLLVGANNSGKTSVLEAISFLASGGAPMDLWQFLSVRDEWAVDDASGRYAPAGAVDVRNLFHGRRIGDEISLKIGAVTSGGDVTEFRVSTPRVPDGRLAEWRQAVTQRLVKLPARAELRALELDRSDRIPRYLRIASPGAEAIDLALQLDGGLAEAQVRPAPISSRPGMFLMTGGINDDALAELYEKIVLTPEEADVIAALREVESTIVRLATRQMGRSRRGFVVGLEGATQPIPLGSLGDGIHRMLAVTLCLVSARGGYLLVDEIDTGLHHTVMQKMWRLVFETAKRLDVTVFATTHSYDCVHALAAIARPDIREGGEVSLIRIERDNPKGTHFTEQEISHLAEWQIEAR